MSRLLALTLFLLMVSSGIVFGQTGSVNDTVSSWHIGINVRKIVQNLRNKAWSPVIGHQQNIMGLEVKAFQETANQFRPAFRLGYREYDFATLKKEISSRGVYGKAGLEWVFIRRLHTNQAIGLHGLVSHIWEKNSLQAGNDYFGYIRMPYEQRVWLPALEFNYAYTAEIAPRLSVQLEAFVTVYGEHDRYRQFGQLPGVARIIDGSVHIFYQLY